MQHVIGIGTIIVLSVASFLVVNYFSTQRALLLTSIGLCISFGWYFAFCQAVENENYIDGIDERFSFLDYLFCIGPSAIYYFIILVVSVIFYVSA